MVLSIVRSKLWREVRREQAGEEHHGAGAEAAAQAAAGEGAGDGSRSCR